MKALLRSQAKKSPGKLPGDVPHDSVSGVHFQPFRQEAMRKVPPNEDPLLFAGASCADPPLRPE